METEDRAVKELLTAMEKSISEVRTIIGEVGRAFVDSAALLRIEQTDRVFRDLSEGLRNLGHLMAYIQELKRGVDHLNQKGYGLPDDSLLCWDGSVGLFKEMHSAFESRDWVTLSDLIQYELYPLLQEGEKGLSELQASIGNR